MSKNGWAGRIIVVLAGVAAVIGAVVWLTREKPTPAQTARPYLSLWQQRRFEMMKRLVAGPPPDFVKVHRKALDDLNAADVRVTPGRIRELDDRAVANFSVSMKLRGLGDWSYRGRLTLRPGKERWMVDWSPATIHPLLGPGRSFATSRSWPDRAPILAADGTAIVGGGSGVVVGLQPGRVKDVQQVASALQDALGSDPAKVRDLLERGRARPDQFIAVQEISEERYGQVRPSIYEVPGLVFQRKDVRLPPSEAFARQLIGRVGPVTKEGLEKLGEPYLAGDVVGQFGLEAALERQLAGRPSGEVRIVDQKGDPVRVLRRFAGEEPAAVRTTLDKQIQEAADSALEGTQKPSALVAVDSQSGQIRAVANTPLNGFNRAVAGKYPPGSTFKVVTSAALLSSGTKPEQKVSCPMQTSAGGRSFRNFEGHDLGEITFRTAFEESCNTAFVNLARALEDHKLAEAAGDFGFNIHYSLPVDTAGGDFPTPRDTTERVAEAIGQGRVTASPLHMASVAAAVANGAWRPPRVLDPQNAGTEAGEVRQLDPAVVSALRSLMGGVVREGTGERAAVPRRDVAGKTGTAEFGNSRPPKTHAWFIGFSGPLAFAVLVEDGGVGGEVAAPIAAKFLSSLGPDTRP